MAIDDDVEVERQNPQIGLGGFVPQPSSSSGLNSGAIDGGTGGNNNSSALNRSILVASSGGFGFPEPTSKMKLFVEMFERNMGQPAFAPLLTAALLARGLGTQMALSNMTMLLRLKATCVTEWTVVAGPTLAETAGEMIMATREEFVQEHGPGGLYHVHNPRGLGAGIGAATGTSSSSSTGRGILGASSPSGTSSTPGETYKNTMTMTRDKDGRMFPSHNGKEAPGFVIKWQHLFRVLLPARITLMLGPDTDLTSESYLDKIRTIYDMVAVMKRSVEDGWTTIPGLRHVNLLRVIIDPEKFGRFLEFKFRAKTPYLLSLNDFLPESSTLEISRKESNTNDMTLLKVALENLSQVLSVVLGEPVESYQLGLKPAMDMVNDFSAQSTPTSWVCYMISFGLQIVFSDFKEGVPLPAEPDKYTKKDAFVIALCSEMRIASGCMPKGDAVSSQVQTFLEKTHNEIAWFAPRKVGGKDTAKEGGRERNQSGSGSEGKDVSDDKVDNRTDTQKRNKRKRDAKKLKAAESLADASSMSGQGAGGGKTSASTAGKYGPSPMCISHLLGLLGVRNDKGYIYACKKEHKTGSSCKYGYHPIQLKLVNGDDAKKAIEDSDCWGTVLSDALKAHTDTTKAKGFSN
jgi:hypothetical protein